MVLVPKTSVRGFVVLVCQVLCELTVRALQSQTKGSSERFWVLHSFESFRSLRLSKICGKM